MKAGGLSKAWLGGWKSRRRAVKADGLQPVDGDRKPVSTCQHTFSRLAGIGLLGLMFGLAGGAQAAEFELALSKDSAAIDILNDSAILGSGGAELSVGGLYNDADDIMGHIGLLVRGVPAGEQPFSFGLGGRVYFAALDDPDASIGALALGAGARYLIPGNIPMAVGADLYYAPGITTFSDGEELLDLKIRFEADVLPSATAFIGWRNVMVGIEDGPDYDIDENVHLGIRILF